MALISLRQRLDHAAENDCGVPAFNMNNREQTRAVMEALDTVGQPNRLKTGLLQSCRSATMRANSSPR